MTETLGLPNTCHFPGSVLCPIPALSPIPVFLLS